MTVLAKLPIIGRGTEDSCHKYCELVALGNPTIFQEMILQDIWWVQWLKEVAQVS